MGGIAGFDDRLVVTTEGVATLTTRDGRIRTCTLPADLVSRTGSVAWSRLPSAAPPTGRSDAMRYVVKSAGHTTVLDADVPPPAQAGAVDTVAALFAAAAACPPAS